MSKQKDAAPEEGAPEQRASPGSDEKLANEAITGGGGREAALERLLAIMAALRDPKTGCPWDLRQDFATIAPYTIEEAYEVADAIARDDMAALKDELGDLLLQVVYHAQLASERGLFDFHDVAASIGGKMVRRHPHVFGGPSGEGGDSASWEAIKRQEREGRSGAKNGPASGALFADVPLALPALRRSAKLQNRAAQLGFDWEDALSILEKVEEEWAELRAEIAAVPLADTTAPPRVKEEFGDLLFVLANLGRHLRADAEEALQAANAKFVRRMTAMERFAEEDGQRLDGLSLAELEALWQRAKATERTPDAASED
jgi:MazG family protein